MILSSILFAIGIAAAFMLILSYLQHGHAFAWKPTFKELKNDPASIVIGVATCICMGLLLGTMP